MAEFSYPFDSGSGAIVTEDDWSDMARNWQDDGVISDSLSPLALEVESLVELNSINVNAGTAIIQGFMYRNTDTLSLSFSTNGSADPRIDRVVLRLDRSTNTIVAAVKEGTPSATPVAPTLDTVYPIYEISLGWYQVNAGASVTLAAIQDRLYTSRFVRVSDTLTGHPRGSILYAPTEDKFYTVGSGAAVEIGAGGGGGSTSMLFVKDVDQTFSTTTRQNDTHLTWLPSDGFQSRCLVEGVIYYWCNTPAASFTFSLGGSTLSAPTSKARFLYTTSGSANLQLLSSSNASLGSLTVSNAGAVASNTFYTIEFQYTGTFIGTDDPEFDTVMPRYTPANAGHQWTISANSWMRITPET